jgi:hypothetical protein
MLWVFMRMMLLVLQLQILSTQISLETFSPTIGVDPEIESVVLTVCPVL